jgi:hypothetical protein
MINSLQDLREAVALADSPGLVSGVDLLIAAEDYDYSALDESVSSIPVLAAMFLVNRCDVEKHCEIIFKVGLYIGLEMAKGGK